MGVAARVLRRHDTKQPGTGRNARATGEKAGTHEHSPAMTQRAIIGGMIEFAAANWGSLASAVGLVVSAVGLTYAVVVARGARSASQAAQKASHETNVQIDRHLRATNLERAIALIQRLKLLHRLERWEAALEQYQALRVMLSEIIARSAEEETEPRRELVAAVRAVRIMENSVEGQTGLGPEPETRRLLYRRLNRIQSQLESLSSAQGFGDSQRGS